jgi:predicted glycosyltransferase
LKTFLDAAPKLPPVTSLIVAGPLMGSSDKATLQKQVKTNKNILFRDYVPDLRPYLRTADVVVSMCGYNTAGEILAANSRAVIVPRTWRYGEHEKRSQTKREGEQIMRATAMTRLGHVRVLEPENLSPNTLSKHIAELLASPKPRRRAPVYIQGIKNAVNAIVQTAVQKKKNDDVYQ